MRTELLIATRTYFEVDANTGLRRVVRDRMYRKTCGSFVLRLASDIPGEPDGEWPCELYDVFKWLRESPWQIERAVIEGGASGWRMSDPSALQNLA
jgi:hypothetical protein